MNTLINTITQNLKESGYNFETKTTGAIDGLCGNTYFTGHETQFTYDGLTYFSVVYNPLLKKTYLHLTHWTTLEIIDSLPDVYKSHQCCLMDMNDIIKWYIGLPYSLDFLNILSYNKETVFFGGAYYKKYTCEVNGNLVRLHKKMEGTSGLSIGLGNNTSNSVHDFQFLGFNKGFIRDNKDTLTYHQFINLYRRNKD